MVLCGWSWVVVVFRGWVWFGVFDLGWLWFVVVVVDGCGWLVVVGSSALWCVAVVCGGAGCGGGLGGGGHGRRGHPHGAGGCGGGGCGGVCVCARTWRWWSGAAHAWGGTPASHSAQPLIAALAAMTVPFSIFSLISTRSPHVGFDTLASWVWSSSGSMPRVARAKARMRS